MKPIIIKVDKDDKVNITVSELKEYLDRAYEEGKKDGSSYYTWNKPITVTTPYYTTTTCSDSYTTASAPKTTGTITTTTL